VSLLLLYSCKPQEKKVPTYSLLTPSDALSFGYFKLGTYWIYQDSISHLTDSVYITSASQGVNSVQGTEAQNMGFGGQFGYFGCELYSTYEGAKYSISLNRTNSPINPSVSTIIRIRVRPNQYDQECIYLNIPYNLNIIATAPNYNFNDSNIVVRDNATYMFNSILLTNILEIDQAHNPICNREKTKIFIKKGYGIIRKEIPDSNRIWNMIRCHIVQ
jgi:hypothetical protein